MVRVRVKEEQVEVGKGDCEERERTSVSGGEAKLPPRSECEASRALSWHVVVMNPSKNDGHQLRRGVG